MNYKRVLTIQDISCVGQCSSTVALPVLSACGHEACVLPSALLSCHTEFSSFTFRDLSDGFEEIMKVWKAENISFDAVYTGYLGTEKQIEQVIEIAETFLKEDGSFIVDPVMGDNGSLYSGFDENYVRAVKKLTQKADVILPNITEACFLTGTEYQEHPDKAMVLSLLGKLAEEGMKEVILTGVSFCEGETGTAIMTSADTESEEAEASETMISEDGSRLTVNFYSHKKLPKRYPGTGDVFASTFTGTLLKGKTMKEAAKTAADFTVKCIENTMDDPSHWYGVKFEPNLRELTL